MITYDQLLATGCEDSKGRISSNWIKRLDDNYINRIVETTSFLPDDTKISLRVLAIKQNIHSHPLCYCGAPVMFHPTKASTMLFARCCSAQCARKDPQRSVNAKNTNRVRYGADTHQQSPIGREKRQATNLEKYGHVSPAGNALVRQKIQATNLGKYGHSNVFGSEYGKLAIQATNRSKYGHTSYNTSLLSQDTIRKLDDPDWLLTQNHTNKYTLQQIADMLYCSAACVHQHFVKHGISVQRHQQSMFERELCDWLMGNDVVVSSDVSIDGKRYDICLPDYNILIECNGIYWHGEHTAGRGRGYHIGKTQAAKQSGYKLIHIFEHDWVLKRDIILSMLRHRLGISTRKIYARSTSIQRVESTTAREFLDANHLQGGVAASTYSYGLYMGAELVSLLTLSTSRFGDSCLEIIRFCNKVNCSVVGGFSRLLKFAEDTIKFDTVVTYADRCWGDGDVYERNGFTYQHDTPPSYMYFKTNDCLTLENRMKFQKHKLSKILSVFDPNISEWANMKANGYDRIWNCGNTKWIWKKPA